MWAEHLTKRAPQAVHLALLFASLTFHFRPCLCTSMCYADGGLNPTPEPCIFPFAYTSTVVFNDVDIYFTLPVTECLRMDEFPPFVDSPAVSLPTDTTDTSKWCATISAYSTEDEQQRLRWGYCVCVNSTTAFPTPQPSSTAPTTESPSVVTQPPSYSPSLSPSYTPTMTPSYSPSYAPSLNILTPSISPQVKSAAPSWMDSNGECEGSNGLGREFRYACNLTMYGIAELACLSVYEGGGVPCVHVARDATPFWSLHNASELEWIYIEPMNNKSGWPTGVYLQQTTTANATNTSNATNVTLGVAKICCSTLSPSRQTLTPTTSPTEVLSTAQPSLSTAQPLSSTSQPSSTTIQPSGGNPQPSPVSSTNTPSSSPEFIGPTADSHSPTAAPSASFAGNATREPAQRPENCSAAVKRTAFGNTSIGDSICLSAVDTLLCTLETRPESLYAQSLEEACFVGGVNGFVALSCECQTAVVNAAGAAGVLCLGTVRKLYSHLDAITAENTALRQELTLCVPGYV